MSNSPRGGAASLEQRRPDPIRANSDGGGWAMITNQLKMRITSGVQPVRDFGRRLRHGIRDPIVVFQMGKVGSTAVHRALVKSRLGVPIHHVHLMEDLDAIEESVRRLYPNPIRTLQEIGKGRNLRREIERSPVRVWNVITLVRDPVARNVSAFFEALDEVLPGYSESFPREHPDAEFLLETFLNRFDQSAPVEWFEGQLKPVFGIDVFETPFPHDRGFQIIEDGRARLLIIRTEDLRRVASEAFSAFFGVSVRPVAVKNDAGGKWYADSYADFLAHARLPDGYLDSMYGSRYAQHFFAPREIAHFRTRWSHDHDNAGS